MGSGCGPNCTIFTLNVLLSTLSEDELESIRQNIITLLQNLGAGRVTVSFREGTVKAYASHENPVNDEVLNETVTKAGDIQTLGNSKFIIADINGKATEYNNKLIIVKTNNEIVTIDGDGDEVTGNDWYPLIPPPYPAPEKTIKHVAFGKNVKKIGYGAFHQCVSLESLTFPEGMTTIESGAFNECASLAELVLPEGVTKIGGGSFYLCTSLASITLPETVTTFTIEAGAFAGCSSLTSISFPEGATTTGDATFYGCASLASVTLPNTVTRIGASAFHSCSSLESITFPTGVTTIAMGAFMDCTSLASITLPVGVTTLEQGAFHLCTKLASVSLPSTVRTIGVAAFKGCTSLASITIPEGVTTIGSRAFADCLLLASITIPKSVTSFNAGGKIDVVTGEITFPGEVFKNCDKLKTVTFESPRANELKLTLKMFENCTALEAIDLPEKVLFDLDGDLKAETIFAGCTSLAKVTVRDGNVVQYLDNAFMAVPAAQTYSLNFNVANVLNGELKFGANNGAFSNLNGNEYFTFGADNSGGPGVKTVEPASGSY